MEWIGIQWDGIGWDILGWSNTIPISRSISRSRGRQKTRLTNTINERLGLTINEAITTAQDRDKWRTIVYAATAVREAECSEQ